MDIGKTAVSEDLHVGNGTVGTSEAALVSVTFPVAKAVYIKADLDNSNVLKFGAKGQAATGFVLKAGETSPPIYVDDLAKLYVVGGASGQLYSWMAL